MLDIRPVRKNKQGPQKLTNKEGRGVKFGKNDSPPAGEAGRKQIADRKRRRMSMDGIVRREEINLPAGKAGKQKSETRSVQFKKEIIKKAEKKGIRFLAGVKDQSVDFWEGVKKLDKRELFGFKSRTLKGRTKQDKKWYQRWWFNFFIITFFVALALVMTYPLIKYFATGMPGDGGDGGVFLWDMWWVKHAILDLHQDPFYTDLIAAPHRVDLTFHTLALFNSVISIPLQLIFGTVVAFNLVFIGGFVLTGWGMYLLVRYLTKSQTAGLIAGVMLSFAPYIMVRSLGHFNLSTIWPIPFFILFFVKMLYEKKWYPAIMAGIFAGILCLNSLQYAVLFAVFVLLLYIFYLIAEPKRFLVSTFLIKSLLMVTVALLVFSPLLFPAIMNYRMNQLEKIPLSRYVMYSADLVRFVVPSYLSTFFGEYASEFKTILKRGGIEGTIFLGYTVLFLSTISIFFASFFFKLRHKIKKKITQNKMRVWHWFTIAFIFAVLALGPVLYIAGEKNFKVSNITFDIAMPFLAIYQLPFLGDMRAPSRFSIFTMITLVITAGIGLGYIFKSIGKLKWLWVRGALISLIGLVFFGAVFVEFLSIPIAITDTRVPAVYEEIKRDPEDCAILDLPCGFATGYYGFGKPKGIIQSYQMVHQKKLVSAMLSRFPRSKVEMYLTMPGLGYLIDPERPVTWDKDFKREDIDREFKKLNLKYFIVHKKYYNQGVQDRLDIYLKYTVGAKEFYEDADTKAYRIDREHLPTP